MSEDVATHDPRDGSRRAASAAGSADRSPGLVPRLVRGSEDPALAGCHVAGVVSFAGPAGAARWSGPGLVVDVPLVVIGDGPVHEIWTADTSPEIVAEGPVSAAIVPDAMFGRIEVPAGPIADAARATFTDVLRFCARLERPHPVRVWCVLPDIHASEGSLERYQAFCAGRARAFEDCFGDGCRRRLCASTAVGSRAGSTVVYFLSSARAGIHVENPRQLSAYSYPSCHGPRSPSFARATVAWEHLLVSGTASIVGHESVHRGDVRAQVDETLDNIDTLRRTAGYSAGRATWKVYVRDGRDTAVVLERMRERIGEDEEILVLIADVCRRELLVEIEVVVR